MTFSSVKGCSGIAALGCLLAAVSSQAQPRPQPTPAQPPARYETVLNRLEAVTSAPWQDAWEIKFDEKFWDLKQPEEVRLVESGPARAVVRVSHKFQNSTFVQDIILSAGVPRVDV